MLPGIKIPIITNQLLSQVQFITVLSSATTTLTIPTDGTVQVGDIAVWINVTHADTRPSYVTPTGFTLCAQASTDVRNTDIAGQIFYKVIAQSDIGSTFTGMNGIAESIALLIFRPIGNYVSTSAVNFSAGAALTSGVSLTLSTAGVAPFAIGIAAAGSDGTITLTASGFTIGTSNKIKYGYSLYNIGSTVPASQPISCNDAGTNVLLGGYILIS